MDHEELVELDDEERGAEATTTSPSSSLLSEGDVINTQLNSLSSNKFLWLVVMFAAMGGLLFGYDIGVISGVLIFIRTDFGLTSAGEEVLVSFVLVGGVIGVLISGYLCEVKGRKNTIGIATVFFSVGALVMAVCPLGMVWLLVVGRLIVGLGIGLSTMTIPLYIAEISPAVHRGKLVAADELFIVLGIFLSFLVNWIVKVTEVSHPWRVSFGISIAFALIQLFGLYFLPESPRWLISQNRDEEAHNIFKRIRESKDEIDREIAEIHDALAQVDHHLTWVSALPLLVNSENRKPLIISLTLAMFVQFTGQPTVLYYCAKVIESTAAFGPSELFAAAALPMLVKLLATAVTTFAVIDRFGRRKPLMIGMGLMALFLALLGLSFFISISGRGWLIVALLSCYVAAFAIGLGPACFVVFSEIFPPHLRSYGQSLSLASMLFFNLIVSMTFLSLADLVGVGTVFFIYSVISVLGVIFVYFSLPETNGRTLEQTTTLFNS